MKKGLVLVNKVQITKSGIKKSVVFSKNTILLKFVSLFTISRPLKGGAPLHAPKNLCKFYILDGLKTYLI